MQLVLCRFQPCTLSLCLSIQITFTHVFCEVVWLLVVKFHNDYDCSHAKYSLTRSRIKYDTITYYIHLAMAWANFWYGALPFRTYPVNVCVCANRWFIMQWTYCQQNAIRLSTENAILLHIFVCFTKPVFNLSVAQQSAFEIQHTHTLTHEGDFILWYLTSSSHLSIWHICIETEILHRKTVHVNFLLVCVFVHGV